MSWPKTLADEPSLVDAIRVHLDAPFDARVSATEVYAPCCGRRVTANAIIDVRHVRGTFVTGSGRDPSKDQEWLCDACRARMFRDPSNAWTRATLYALCGAPAEAIRMYRIEERAEAIARDMFARGQSVVPAETLAQAIREVG